MYFTIFSISFNWFFLKKIDPKINFLITSVLSYFLIIYFGLYFFEIKIIYVIASLLLLTSSIIINFTIWSILIWGFTVSLLESIINKKRITKSKWIKIYTRNKSLDFFTQDRIKLLLLIKSIKKKKILFKLIPLK